MAKKSRVQEALELINSGNASRRDTKANGLVAVKSSTPRVDRALEAMGVNRKQVYVPSSMADLLPEPEETRRDNHDRYHDAQKAGVSTFRPGYGYGNIDLSNRPVYHNPDGTISTVDSFSVNMDGKEVLLPSIGRDRNGNAVRWTQEQAIDNYRRTGENLGVFNTVQDANTYADWLHNQQADYYRQPGNSAVAGAETKDYGKPMILATPGMTRTNTGSHSSGGFDDPRTTPTFWDRIGNTIKSGVFGRASGDVDAAATVSEVVGPANRRNKAARNEAGKAISDAVGGGFWGNYLRMLVGNPSSGDMTTDAVRSAMESLDDSYVPQLHETADTLKNQAETAENRAKDGLGWLGRMAVDAGTSGVNMLIDRAETALAPGLGLAAMGVRAFGNAAGKARNEGATANQQMLYGLANAAVEVGSEKLGDIPNVYGGGLIDDAVEGVIKRIAKTPAVERAAKIAAATVGESLEELVAGIIEPGLESIYTNEGYFDHWKDGRWREDAIDTLEAMFVGGLLGGLGGGTQVGIDAVRNAPVQNTNSKINNAYAAMQENGMFSPKAQPAVNAAQQAVDRQQRRARGRNGYINAMPTPEEYEQNANQSSGEFFSKMGKDAITAIIDQGMESAEGTRSRTLAEAAAKRIMSGETLTQEEIGQLYRANVEAISEEARQQNQTPQEYTTERPEQTAAKSRADVRNVVNVAAATMGEQGTRTAVMYRDRALDTDPAEYYNAAREIYDQGMNGAEMKKSGEILSDPEARAWYDAGRADAAVAQQTAPVESAESQKRSAAETVQTVPEVRPGAQFRTAAALAQAAPAQNEMRGASQNGEEIIAEQGGNEGQRRVDRLDSAEQSARLDGGAEAPVGQNGGGRSAAAQTYGDAQSIKAQKAAAEKLAANIPLSSSAEKGISSGTNFKTFREIPKSTSANWTEPMKRVTEKASKKNVKVHWYTGRMMVDDGYGPFAVRGLNVGDGSEIWIRADADEDIEKIADHELFHTEEKRNPDLKNEIRHKITEGKSDEQLSALIRKYQDNYKNAGLTDEQMLSEIFADAYAGIDVFAHITPDKNASPTENVRAPQFRQRVEEAVANSKPTGAATENNVTTASREESDVPDGMERTLDKLGAEIRYDVVVPANIASMMDGPEYHPPISVSDIADLASHDTMPEWSKKYTEGSMSEKAPAWVKDIYNGNMDEATLKSIQRFDDLIWKKIGGQYTDTQKLLQELVPHGHVEDTKFGPLRDNEEYVFTFDMDTSCPRTFQFVSFRNEIQRRLQRTLTLDESINLINLMGTYKQMLPCTYCYVETKRILKASYYNSFYGYHKAVMDGIAKGLDIEDLRKVMYGWDAKKHKLTKAAEETLTDVWMKDKSGYNPTIEENYHTVNLIRNAAMHYLDDMQAEGKITADTTAKSLTNILAKEYGLKSDGALAEAEKIAEDWRYDAGLENEHTYLIDDTGEEFDKSIADRALDLDHEAIRYANSASSAKSVLSYIPYNGNLLNVSDEDRAYVMGMGGIRKHSSNDFRIDYVLDYFQFYADLARGKWTGHTYTKSEDYVRIFGRTGDMINMSIAFNDTEDGVVENSNEGMEHAIAKELREAYQNAGIMAMVTSDKQLSYALNADWIDMIIPFHHSGLPKKIWYNMKAWADYTAVQSEAFYDKKEKTAALKSRGINTKGMSTEQISNLFDETFHIKAVYKEKAANKKDIGKRFKPHFYPNETVQNGVKIPGHNNSKARYLELCKEYGVHPRFDGVVVKDANGNDINVVDHPNYMKLIKETSRAGENFEQPTIEFTMNKKDPYLTKKYGEAIGKKTVTPMDYAMYRLANDATLVGKPEVAASNDAAGIVDKFIQDYAGKGRPVGWLSENALNYKEGYDSANDKLVEANREKMREEFKKTEGKKEKPKVRSNFYTGNTTQSSSKAMYSIEFLDSDHMPVLEVSDETTDRGKDSASRDTDYIRAVESGDMETAQKMVDEAAKTAGYDSPKLYHGTSTFGFTRPEGMLFATDSAETAGTYSGTAAARSIADQNKSSLGMYQFYANTDGMLDLDAKGAETNHIALGQIEDDFNNRLSSKTWRSFATINQIIKYARESGNAGVIVRNVIDGMTPESRKALAPATDYVFFDPQSQVKSADPVTYDDAGNVIPLSERFNTEDQDIRYSMEDLAERDTEEMLKMPNSFIDSEVGERVQYSYDPVSEKNFHPLRDENGNIKYVYKAFYAMKDENGVGRLYPPMVSNLSDEEKKKIRGAVSGTQRGLDTPVGIVLDADVGMLGRDKEGNLIRNKRGRLAVQNDKGGGTLAFRPGWHSGEWPDAKQFNKDSKKYGKRSVMPDSLVFARCEISGDKDYQLDAMRFGVGKNGKYDRTQAGLPRLPVNGYYKYRTNPDPQTAPWYISGQLKIVEILTDEQCREICAQYGVTPNPRESDRDINLEEYGLKSGPVTPETNTERYLKSEQSKQNERELEEALADENYADAYTPGEINFDDPEIQKEFARNKQDVDYYRRLSEKTMASREDSMNDRITSLLRDFAKAVDAPKDFRSDGMLLSTYRVYRDFNATRLFSPDADLDAAKRLDEQIAALLKEKSTEKAESFVDWAYRQVSDYYESFGKHYSATESMQKYFTEEIKFQNEYSGEWNPRLLDKLNAAFDATDFSERQSVETFLQTASEMYHQNGERFVIYGEEYTPQKQSTSYSRETDNRLLQQNIDLQKRLDAALADTKQTRGWRAAQKDVERVAADIIKATSSKESNGIVEQKIRSLVEAASNGGIDSAEMKDLALDIARGLLKRSSILTTPDATTYDAMRKYLKSIYINVPTEMRKQFTDWKAFAAAHKAMRMKTDGVGIGTVYAELQKRMGEDYFPALSNDMEKLQQIAEILDNLTPVYDSPYSVNMAEAAEETANGILESILDIGQAEPTYADRAKAREGEIREFYHAKMVEQAEYMRQRIQDEADRRKEQTEALKQHYAEVRENQRTRKQESADRQKLLRVAKRLQNRKLDSVNRAIVDQLVGDLDTVSVHLTNKTLTDLSELRDWYESFADDPNFLSIPSVEEKLKRLEKRHIGDMTMDEVRDLTDVLRSIENSLAQYGKMIRTEDRRLISEMSTESQENILNTRGSRKGIRDWLVTNTLAPERLIRRLTGYNDTDPLYMRVKELSEGQRKMFDYQRRAEEMFSKWTNDKKLIERLRDKDTVKIRGFVDGKETTVDITPDMRMALYLHSLNDQNLRHIANGGVTIPDIELYRKGDAAEAYSRGKTVKLSPEMVRGIATGMSTEERAFANAARSYFNGMSRDEINAVSEALLGYSLAQVENYFPIQTDDAFTQKEIDAIQNDGSIQGMGFTKERQNASNAIFLVPMTDVLKRSIQNHAKYVGMAIPVANINKLWMANTKDDATDSTHGLKDAVRSKWGAEAKNAIDNIITDVQNPRRSSDAASKALSAIRSNYAGAVLTLNASVALKQAASYPTAAAVLGWEPLLKAMGNVGRVDLDTINKYTPLQWYRSKGYSTQEIGDIRSKGGIMDKVLSASIKTKNGREVPLLNWIQGIDLLTTRKLWKASEYYVQQNQKNLRTGTEDYYKAVADIYNRVIEETQPNYTTMQRPQALRTDNQLLQTMVMFKTQPFQNFNILYDAIGELRAAERMAKNGDESKLAQAKKNAFNAVSSNLVSAVVFAAMTMAWAMARRKKDKYEDKEGNFNPWAQLGKDVLSSEFGMIPFGSDAYELLASWVFGDKYYGMSNITADSISGALDATKNAFDTLSSAVSAMLDGEESTNADPETIARKLYASAKDLSKLAGIPLDNVVNLVTAIYSNVASAVDGEYVTAYYVLRLNKDLSTSANKSAAYDILYKAYKQSPTQYHELRDMMIEDGFKESNIDKAMKNRAEK